MPPELPSREEIKEDMTCVGSRSYRLYGERCRQLLAALDRTAELELVHIEARELVGEADATGIIPQANLDALRALLWRATVRQANRAAAPAAEPAQAEPFLKSVQGEDGIVKTQLTPDQADRLRASFGPDAFASPVPPSDLLPTLDRLYAETTQDEKWEEKGPCMEYYTAENAAFIAAIHNAWPEVRQRIRELESSESISAAREAESGCCARCGRPRCGP